MWWKTGRHAHNENQPKRDLLAMTEADREVLTARIKEHLEQRVREIRINREARALFGH
jgi:hypothetical protein